MAIEKGTIKVVWITNNTNRIYSQMFENINEAKKFGESKRDYLIFKLLWYKKMKLFAWELLPYGNYKLYESVLKLYQKYRGKIIGKILGL